MDGGMFRPLGEAIEALFWLAAVVLPLSLILNVILSLMLWWKW